MSKGKYSHYKKRDPRGRHMTDEELESVFEQLSEHIELLRTPRMPLIKVCDFGTCDEGPDTFTVYLDNAKSVNLSRMYQHIEEFNRATGYNIEAEADTDEDGGTSWMLFIPLYVQESTKIKKPRHRHYGRGRSNDSNYGELIKWASVFIVCNVGGYLLNEPTIYQIARNTFQI